jgi:CHAT domain-containing protein/Tfp pilus assembly protein PilF
MKKHTIWTLAFLCVPLASHAQGMKRSDAKTPVELVAVDPEIQSLLDGPNLSCDTFNITDRIATLQKAVGIANDRSLIRDRALAEAVLASTYIGNGQMEDAFAMFQRALQDAIDSGNKVLEADLLLSLSLQAQMKENKLQVADLIAKALSLSEKSGSLYEKARALGARGQLELSLGKLDEATQSIDQALEIDTLNGYRFEALHMVYRGYYLGIKGQTDAAIDSLIQARTKALAANDIFAFISAENAYAYGLVQKKRGDEAAQELVQLKQGNVQQFAREAKNQTCFGSTLLLPLVHLVVLEGLANVYAGMDQKDKQLEIWEEIQLYSHAHGIVAGEAEAAEKAGNLCGQLKKTSQAVQHYSVAVALLRKLQNEVAVNRVEISQSLLLVEIGRRKEALPLVQEIGVYARRQKLRSLEFAANVELAQIYQPDGDLDHARDCLEKAIALVQPGPFDSEFDNRTVLVAYVRLNEIYKALKLPTKELINIDRVFFVAVHLKDENAQKSELAYLDHRLKELRTREVVEESLKNGHLADSLIYSIILYLRDGFPAKPSDDKSNLDRIGNLPSQIVLQPGGAKALSEILDQLGSFLESEKVPALVSLGRYYIGDDSNPILAEQYASAAVKLLDDAKVDNVPNRVDSTCVLALSYSRQSKTTQAATTIAQCLSLADKTNDARTIRYAQTVNAILHMEKGDIFAAGDFLERLLKDMPDQPDLIARYAASLAKAKFYEHASSELDRAITLYLAVGKKNMAAKSYVLAANALNSDVSEKAKTLQLEYLKNAQRLCFETKSDIDMTDVLGFTGDYYFKTGEMSNAVSNYDEARKLGLKLKRDDIAAINELRLGNASQSQEDFVRAIDLHSRAAQSFHTLRSVGFELTSLQELASDYRSSGDTEKALSTLLLAKGLAENASALDKYLVGYNLGWAFEKAGQFEKALVTFHEALDITNQSGDIAHSAYLHLAISSLNQLFGQWDDVKTNLDIAITLFQQIGDKEGEASTWEQLGGLYSDRTSPIKNADQAKQCYEKAKGLGSKILSDFSMDELYLTTGRYDEAANAASEGLRNCVRSPYPECETNGYLDLAEARRLNGDLASARKALNKARELLANSSDLYNHGRYLNREAQLLISEQKLDEALGVYKELISLIEKVKGSLDLKVQKSLSENYGFIYGNLVSLLYTMSQRESGDTKFFASQALEYTEKNKARQFTESWGRTFVEQMRRSLPGYIQEKERSLFSKRDLLRSTMNSPNASESSASVDDKKRTEEELVAIEGHISNLLGQLRKSSPQYTAVAYPEPIQIMTLPVRREETFVEFKMTDDATFAWIVQNRSGTKNDLVSFYRIPQTRAWFLDRISLLRRALNSNRPGEFDGKVSEELFAALFPAEASRVITESREIIFVPDDVLFTLPFELFSPTATKKEFVFLKRATAYYPSAVSFRLTRAASHPSEWQKSFLGLADPITSSDDERYGIVRTVDIGVTRASSPNGESQVNPAGPSPDKLKARGFSFERLPGTAVEVNMIADLIKKRNETTDIRFGVDATKRELLNTDLSKFRFLHFATHGILPVDTNIKEPSLVLSDDGVSQSHMFLSMSEILALRLQSELVVLSACNTGSGDISRAEGVMSLGRAFLAAGSSSVTVSLWQVSDESTAELMEKYYRGVLAGKAKNVALAEARQTLFSGRYSDPFYWAPFILIGE